MNERISELVLQANPASKEIYESDNWEYNCAAWCAQDLAKFAELIVRECARVADQWVNDEDNGHNLVSDRLRQHFGVES